MKIVVPISTDTDTTHHSSSISSKTKSELHYIAFYKPSVYNLNSWLEFNGCIGFHFLGLHTTIFFGLPVLKEKVSFL